MTTGNEDTGTRGYEELRQRLAGLDAFAVAEELAHLDPLERLIVFRHLPEEQIQAVFEQLDATYQKQVLAGLRDDQVRTLVEAMDPDDRARLIDGMPAAVAQQVLASLSPREQDLTERLLAYPAESAGRIMCPEFVVLQPAMTVAKALTEVRRHGPEVETIYTLPVVDDEAHLVGMVELEDLVFADPSERVSRIMETDVNWVHAEDDQEQVARLVQSADLLAVPVVDANHRLVGLVTFDDAMDVLGMEEGEDWSRGGAAEPLGRPYLAVPVLGLVRSRLVWLLLLAVAATLTVNVLSAYEYMLEAVVSLSLFIPLLIGIGGNCGAQSATTVVRAMAVDDVRIGDFWAVILREGRVGLLLGIVVAVLGYLPIWAFFGRSLASVVCLTLIAICTLGSLVGSIMPLAARRVGVDPAAVSAPFVTTLVDATGLVVYFLIAHALLGL